MVIIIHTLETVWKFPLPRGYPHEVGVFTGLWGHPLRVSSGVIHC